MWCSALSPLALASKTSCPFVTHACNISFPGSITHYLGSNSHTMHPEFNSGKANIWIVKCRCAAVDCSRFYLLNYRLFNDSFSISHLSFPFQFKFQFFLTLPTSLAAHLDTISDILEPNRSLQNHWWLSNVRAHGEACVAGKASDLNLGFVHELCRPTILDGSPEGGVPWRVAVIR